MTEPTDQFLPSVSVLMPAYNYDRFVGQAVRSVLEQDYPADRLELIVVDDGSTDDTAAVVAALAEAHPGRIQLIRQANAGPSAAINRALTAAAGELIAILDADDVWLSRKVRAQAELLSAEPQVSMTFCDMRVVDGDGGLVRPSQVGRIGVFPRQALATLLCQNRATQSSIMLRREAARPLPDGVPYSDWWFALCAAQVGEVVYVPDALALYREHGTNLTSGVSGASALREHRKEIAFQCWALRHLDLSTLTPPETAMVWRGVEEHARRAVQAASSQFVELVSITDADRAQARRLAVIAKAAGSPAQACRLLLASLGWDPFCLEVRQRLIDAIVVSLREAQVPGATAV